MARDCTAALKPQTVNESHDEVRNLSLAWEMSESTYNDARRDAGASATIFGIPMGANYGDFKSEVSSRAAAYKLNDFQRYARAYASSTLTKANVDAYRACLTADGGTAIVAEEIGALNYKISVTYVPPPAQTQDLDARVYCTNINRPSLALLHREFGMEKFGHVDKPVTIAPDDSEKEATVTVAVGRGGGSIILPPLIVPIIKRAHVVHEGEVVQIFDRPARVPGVADTVTYRFTNLGPGVLELYENNAPRVQYIAPGATLTEDINNGPTNVKVYGAPTTHYYWEQV